MLLYFYFDDMVLVFKHNIYKTINPQTAIFILIVGCGLYPMISKSSNLKLSISETLRLISRVGNGRGSLWSCESDKKNRIKSSQILCRSVLQSLWTKVKSHSILFKIFSPGVSKLQCDLNKHVHLPVCGQSRQAGKRHGSQSSSCIKLFLNK